MKDFYRLTPYPRSSSDWDVVEFADPDTAEAVILAYRLRGTAAARRVFPMRLDARKIYRIVDPLSSRKRLALSGKALMEKGLRLSLSPESALIRHLTPLGAP
jgi:hypothetical protein